MARGRAGVPLTSADNFIVRQLNLTRQNTGVVVHDERLGWRLATDVYVAGGAFTTGPHGLRMNANAVRPPQPGGILAVGDSFTAGAGVRDDEAWPAQLERMIAQPVHNAAAGGWGVDQMVLRAEQLMPELRPRVVIVSILAQDSLRNAYEVFGGAHKPYFVTDHDTLSLRGVPVPRSTAPPLELGLTRRVAGHSFLVHSIMMRARPAQWLHDPFLYKRVQSDVEAIGISCRLMERLARLRDEHRVRVIVAMQYGAGESVAQEPPWYGPRVLECARGHGLSTVDAYPPLHALSAQDAGRFNRLWLNEGGQLGHMSAEGNRLVAAFFRDVLARP